MDKDVYVKCVICKGKGWLLVPLPGERIPGICPWCNGKKKVKVEK